MKEPGFLQYALLTTVCLFLALIGLYLLANFNRLFRGSIRNEWMRRNVAALLVIFFLNSSISPMSGNFYYILERYGWWMTILGQFLSCLMITLLVFNTAAAVVQSRRLKKLSFAVHNLILLFTVIITTVAVNVPVSYYIFDYKLEHLKYPIISSIYIAGVIGLVYAAIDYFDIERKRKFHEKELEFSLLRELKTKAELDALHSKVNPHFLYNALNSIADLSVTDGRKARKMTVALADLFRYSINYSNNNFSTVQEELEMAEVYLQIEKIRFEDKLNYSIRLDENLKHYLVPRFLLQPVVENAVKHGLKATGKTTEITIEVEKEANGMVFNIVDSGPEFPEQLNPGYGVKSVYDKMDLLFPGQYSIEFSNHPRKQVSIHIYKLVKNEQSV